MTQNINLWMFNENVVLKTNLNASIKKIANIDNHVFVLTQDLNFYQGRVETSEDGNLIELTQIVDFKVQDIDSCKENLFLVTTEGNIFICDEQLAILSEVYLEENHKCLQGHTEFKYKEKVKNIAVSEYGRLFISESNQLWGSGYMPQVKINSDIPKKIGFFEGRRIHNVSIGSDFAVVVVSKNLKSDKLDDLEEDLFMPNCPKCQSVSERTSPESRSSTKEICPLGIKINSNFNLENMQESEDIITVDDTQKCLDKEEKLKLEKNVIFRNTEAAKDFLSRQISRMSSVGEEYLMECTEKPTRIIKANMSNVASFVYEGVKTVSDKVATLSRHVSSSSDCNSISENNNGQIPNGRIFKEDILLSGSQSTSEKDLSDIDIQGHIESILNNGVSFLNKEVWTWGNIFHGLPGIGEIKKELPIIISMLSNIGVCKISLQNHHACALTLDGRAFIWGQNNYHQVTLENNFDQMSPKLFDCNVNERVRDAICGAHFTMILTNKCNAIYFGKGSEKYENLFNKAGYGNTNNEDHSVNLFDNLISTKRFSLLNLGPKMDDYFSDFLFKEQIMLEEMLCVHRYVIKLFLKKTNDTDNSLLYESLCKNYTDMLYFLCVNVRSLLEHRNGMISIDETSILKYFKEYISGYQSYCNIINDVESINGFEYISKLVTVTPNLHKLKSGVLEQNKSSDSDMSLIFLSPVKRLNNYTDFYQKYATKDIQLQWKNFMEYSDAKVKDAKRTHNFWIHAGKNISYLIEPGRRLICDSQSEPINLQNSSRFFSHRFVLFTDIFAHINGSTSYVHFLTMIWLDLPHHDSFHLINLNMPEETLTLMAPDGVLKNKWYHALQHGIKVALNKGELMQPPLARRGTYTFTKSGFFKDATYNGRWLNAKMHGTGKIKWPDGRIYMGQCANNFLSKYGTMEIPNVGSYEGQWKDNKQDGYGTFTYSNKDIYKGHFKDGTFNGHGLLHKGNFMANSASLYIGEWVSGQKSGYGVMDDIATGEKYIGLWRDGKKEGTGLIVTSDGIYYEGNFHNDVLLGHGIMVFEDGTHYEGEFKGTGMIGGKGTLTLPAGHTIEGNLIGSMQEGIKINSGIFHRNVDLQMRLPESFGKLCTPPSQKWKALFRHCYDILGLPEDCSDNDNSHSLETPKIWQNVAVYLSNASTLKMNKRDNSSFQNSLQNLDVIPPFGKDRITMESYLEIKNYLNRAFESSFHPLGSLINHLSEAYIASYSGKIHPILVTHAILEIMDLTQRVYEIIRYLFPALPGIDTNCIIKDNERDEVISYQSLLYPVILPRIYNCLSTLLTLKNEQQERQYKRALMEWNKLSNHGLMTLLSVDKKFFNFDQCISDESHGFTEAIETLQQIKSMFLPIEKLIVIRNTVEKMTPVAQNLLGDRYVWNMDDLFPLFLYVVVRARIPDLGAELEFMENFMDPSLENGELGIMFTTLKACYQQILQDKAY